MKRWYVRIGHIPTHDGEDEGPAIWWAHGRKRAAVGEKEATDEWLDKNGFKTAAAAKRELMNILRWLYGDTHWRAVSGGVIGRDVVDADYIVNIRRVWEVSILRNGEEIYCETCYGDRKMAEDYGERALKLEARKRGEEKH